VLEPTTKALWRQATCQGVPTWLPGAGSMVGEATGFLMNVLPAVHETLSILHSLESPHVSATAPSVRGGLMGSESLLRPALIQVWVSNAVEVPAKQVNV